jgi:hypothetical protein
MRKVLIFTALLVFLLAGLAQADFTGDLNLGGTFNSVPIMVDGKSVTEGGGSIITSYLNGTALPWVYCIGMDTVVYVPSDYNQTYVNTTTGKVYDNGFGGLHDLNQVANAGQVAWLLASYANSPTVDQVALQAAIWHVINPGHIGLDTTSAGDPYRADYNAYLTALGSNTGDTTQFLWMSPANGTLDDDGGLHHYQGLVTQVPIPGAVWLLGSGLAALLGLRRKYLG